MNPALLPFELDEVLLLDGPFKTAQDRCNAYLLSLDADRLIHTFRLTARLPSSAEPYGGWESPSCELRGHSLGHYLSAGAMMHRANPVDDALKSRVDYIVAQLAKCQAALKATGSHDGYLSAFPESFFDRVDARQNVWAPWYTMHKIMAGLLDAYQHAGNQQALDVLKQLATWTRFRADRLSCEQMQASLETEHGGMSAVLADLHAVTRDPEHLRIAQAFNHRVILDPLSRGQDKLDGLHANTQIPKLIGARQYELTNDESLRDAALFFWREVALRRSYSFGGHSDREHFFPPAEFGKHLSIHTAETCNTYNMLKLTRQLYSWDPSPAELMDFYERALFNQILGSQEPDGGMIYFLSTLAGDFRRYNTPDRSFWCCTGTGMENHAKYGDTIYFRDAGEENLYVNLFIASELNWKSKGLTIRQETRFPQEEQTSLHITCAAPTKLALKIRRPSWAKTGIIVHVNDEKMDVDGSSGSYVALNRTWRDGDVVRVKFPMLLHVEPLPSAPRQLSVMFGPIVLAAPLGREGVRKEDEYVVDQWKEPEAPTPAAPQFIVSDPAEILRRIERQPGDMLKFVTKSLARPRDVTLIPFYQLHHERYAVYFAANAHA